MAAARGARMLWTKLGGKLGFTLRPTFPKCLTYHGLVPAPRLAFQVWPEVQALDRPGDTLRVVGRGVLIRARLPVSGPAQSVYRAELMALVTALQGSVPGATGNGT
eukprot:6459439-Amphidinium_carterae.2